MGIGAWLRLVFSALAGLLRRSGEARDDFAAVTNAQENLIDTLRADHARLTDRCDMLQRSFDGLLEDVGTLRVGLINAEAKLADCEARHLADARRIRQLEARVAELEAG